MQYDESDDGPGALAVCFGCLLVAAFYLSWIAVFAAGIWFVWNVPGAWLFDLPPITYWQSIGAGFVFGVVGGFLSGGRV